MTTPEIPPPTASDNNLPLKVLWDSCFSHRDSKGYEWTDPIVKGLIRRCHSAETRFKDSTERANADAGTIEMLTKALTDLKETIASARQAWLFKSPSGNYHLFDEEQFANAGDCNRVALVPLTDTEDPA